MKERLWNSNYLRVWSANFMLFFSFMLLTPMLPLYLSDTFGADKETIGAVLAGYTVTTLLVRPFSGFLVDSFPRKVVLMVTYFLFAAFFAGYLIAGTLTAFFWVRTLHGLPFGGATVSNSTVAIDVLPSSRRNEGIGYYGLSNNIATAIAPSVALWIYAAVGRYTELFWLSLAVAMVGLGINSTLKLRPRPKVASKEKLSFDRFIFLKGWALGLCMVAFAFSYGVLATYIAIYGKQELGIEAGTGVFFLLLALGLILSRVTGTPSLRKGLVMRNAQLGICVSLAGYTLFAALHQPWAYYASALVIGLGNGHLWPAFLSMFIAMAPHERRGTANSTLLVSWDIGIGIGTWIGGAVAQRAGFHAAFWTAAAVNAAGVLFYLLFARGHFKARRRPEGQP